MELPKNKNISKIDLSNHNLSNIPKEIFNYRNLRKLNLANNNILTIPKEISKLRLLEVLNLADNRINNLYAKVFELKNLKTLILNNNKIKKIPIQLNNLHLLRTFGISSNYLTEIPESIYSLDQLRKLNISNNKIGEIENRLLCHNSIEHLWLNNLPVSKFSVIKYNDFVNLVDHLYCFSNIANNENISDDIYQYLTKHKGNCRNQYIKIVKRHTETQQPIVSKEIISSKESTSLSHAYIKENMKKNRIFVSYSHKDQKWLERVQSAIKSMNLSGIYIDLWSDKQIKTSQVWKEEIKKALNSSVAAILLISTDFLASDFIVSEELPTLLKNAELKKTKIINLIIKPSRFKHIPSLSRFQAVNDLSKPLCKIPEYEQEEMLVKLTEDIEDIV